jgi:hypothetical protein
MANSYLLRLLVPDNRLMRNPLPGLSCSAALLVLAADCGKAQFAPIVDGVGGAAGSGDAPDAGVPVPCAPPAEVKCFGPSTAGICDPVCQTGDSCNWCSQKCTYSADTANPQPQPICVDSAKSLQPFSPCMIANFGTSRQSDDCLPGYICLQPTPGSDPPYCFQLCAVAQDCVGMVACGQRALFSGGGNVSVCDPPYSPCAGTCCNPLNPSDGIGCPAGQVCFLVSPDDASQPMESQTVCEYSSGSGQAPCAAARDCLPKTTCVAGKCQQVCSATTPCANGGACTMLGKEYGYCPN